MNIIAKLSIYILNGAYLTPTDLQFQDFLCNFSVFYLIDIPPKSIFSYKYNIQMSHLF